MRGCGVTDALYSGKRFYLTVIWQIEPAERPPCEARSEIARQDKCFIADLCSSTQEGLLVRLPRR